MHELLVDLWPWLLGFYVVDSLAQLQRGHLLLASAGGPFAALRSGLHLAGVSPLSEGIALFDLPCLEAETELVLFDPRSRADPAVVEELDLWSPPTGATTPLSREGRKVSRGGTLLLVAPTPEHAEVERERLSAPRPREDAPERAADLAPIHALRAAQRPWLLPLRATGGLLALAVGVGWPAVAWGPPELGPLAGWLLAGVAGLTAIEGALVFAMWRACGERWKDAAAAALHLVAFPVAAIHPLWHASRPLYRHHAPLAVAAALLPAERFARLAGRELRRAGYSRAATRPGLAAAWDARTRLIERLLEGRPGSRAVALAPPRREGGAAAWCPLCRVQWRAGSRCDDCGVPLEPYPTEPPGA